MKWLWKFVVFAFGVGVALGGTLMFVLEFRRKKRNAVRSNWRV